MKWVVLPYSGSFSVETKCTHFPVIKNTFKRIAFKNANQIIFQSFLIANIPAESTSNVPTFFEASCRHERIQLLNFKRFLSCYLFCFSHPRFLQSHSILFRRQTKAVQSNYTLSYPNFWFYNLRWWSLISSQLKCGQVQCWTKMLNRKKYSPTPVTGCYEVLATRKCERKLISVSE